MSSTKFVFFGRTRKTRLQPWSLIGWDIFHFSSENAEWNSIKLNRKQDLNVLDQVCVFRADKKKQDGALASDWLRHFPLLLWNCWTEIDETWQEWRYQHPLPSLYFLDNRKNKMAALASDLLIHFQILLWNCWTEFSENWQEERYMHQHPLPNLCFSGRWEKEDGGPGLWLAETFSTSPLKPLNLIQLNLTGSKISTSSSLFVFFGPIGKNNMVIPASDWLRHFWLLLWNRWTEFN